MPGSDAKSAYSGLYTIDGPTFAPLQRSQYVIPDKVTASVGYVIPAYLFPRFFNGEGVRINLFYTAFSAGGYSYFYSNDLNGDGMATDLMYIPNNVDEIRFATEADKEAFKTFMENDPYLSTHKGQYAEANAGRGPWIHLLDARIAKAFKKKIGNTTHSIELSASFDNILNMFNSAWGLYKYGCYGEFASWACTPLAVDHIENNTPVFSMNKVEGEYPTHTYTRNDLKDSAQCWSVLLGVKYSF